MMRSLFTVLVSVLLVYQGMAQTKRMRRAESAYQQGAYAKALVHSNKATQHQRTKYNPQTWLIRGKIYQALAQQASSDSLHTAYLHKAISSYHTADTLSEGGLTPASQPRELLWKNYMTQAQQLSDQQQYTAAKAALERAILVKPKDTGTYLVLGELAMQKQDYTLAQETYLYLLDTLQYEGSQLYEVYNTLIQVLALQKKEMRTIREVLKQARHRFPDSTQWVEREFALFINHERWSEAEALTRDPLLSTARKIEFLRELAQQHRIRNTVQPAFDYYQRALALDAQNMAVLYDLAYLHRQEAIAAEKEMGHDQASVQESQEEVLFHYRESLRYLNQAVLLDQRNHHLQQNITLVKTHISSLENL